VNSASKTFARVAKFCHSRLLKNEEVMTYLLENRQIQKEYIDKFQVGLFPQDLRELFEKEDPKELRELDVIYHASYSRFKIQDLVMPIADVYGDYIAIAGRTRLSEQEREKKGIAKYMNSIYKKSNHLFGLNFAKRSIIEKGVAYVVEGYFDVIASHQKGMDNVVAVCGKYLSTRHVALLSRYTDKIVLLFDNEEEAQQRARHIVEKKQYDGITLTAVNPFPKGAKDIDDYFLEHSMQELLAILNSKGNYGSIKPLWEQ
jgi:DNA primase